MEKGVTIILFKNFMIFILNFLSITVKGPVFKEVKRAVINIDIVDDESFLNFSTLRVIERIFLNECTFECVAIRKVYCRKKFWGCYRC